MKIDSNYIQQHLAQQEAIKLRAIEINNFLSDVEVDTDWRDYDYCNVAYDWLEVSVTDTQVSLEYDDGDWPRYWSVPTELFEYDNEQLISYAKIEAKKGQTLQDNLDYMRLRDQAKELGYRLVKEEE